MSPAPRPPIDLDGPLEGLPGIGPKGRERLAAAGVHGPVDLLFTLPSRITRLDEAVTVDALLGSPASGTLAVRGSVARVAVAFFRGRSTTKVTLTGEKGALVLHYPFRAHAAAKLAVGVEIVAVGALAHDTKGRPYMLAPKIVTAPFAPALVEYPEHVQGFRAAIEALTAIEALPEPVPPPVRDLFALAEGTLRAAHLASTCEALSEGRRALRVAEALARAFLSETEPGEKGAPLPAVPDEEVEAALGVTLTEEQARVVREVAGDLARDTPMRRALLGDVGTGKTLVACAAIVATVRAEGQAVVFAPTAALVEQWATRLRAVVLAGVPLRVHVVTRDHAAEDAPWDVAVGTHALVHRALTARPTLLVVDEPQRTGTKLRDALVRSGNEIDFRHPHVLLLTATPLPRTLALTDDGALATSVLAACSWRAHVTTRLVTDPELELTALEDAKAAIARGERVFVVAARIARGAKGAPGIADVASRVARALPEATLAVVHASLSREAQRAALEAFRTGRADVLVATSVVEVGLDVPEATRMIVLSAERFGASQLHQLRGRVGRGGDAAVTWLVHAPNVARAALARLHELTLEASGLGVARADLAARGPGERLGTRQSGGAGAAPEPPIDAGALARAVTQLLAEDPRLEAGGTRGFAHVIARVRRGLRYEAAG